jgi:large subunit ribosomal protein L7/L12
VTESATWSYRVSSVESLDATTTVDAHMLQWAEAGWELVSGTATAYTRDGSTQPQMRYVMYWRRRTGVPTNERELTPGSASSEAAPRIPPAPRVEIEPSVFDVVLLAGGDRKIEVIKVVRAATGWGLSQAKALVDTCPQYVRKGLGEAEAAMLTQKLRGAGGTADVRPGQAPWR